MSRDCCGCEYSIKIQRGNGELLANVSDVFASLEFDHAIDSVPRVSFDLPIKYAALITARGGQATGEFGYECVVTNTCGSTEFIGVLDNYIIDKVAGIIALNFTHVLKEWSFTILPPNYAVVEATFDQLYNNDVVGVNNFGLGLSDGAYVTSTPWAYNIEPNLPTISYLYSLQDRLTALGDTLKLTRDVHFRVPRIGNRTLDIGRFGQNRGWIAIPIDEPSEAADNIIPIINIEYMYDQTDVINELVVVAGTEENGYNQVTLREILNFGLDDPLFPVNLDFYFGANYHDQSGFGNPINNQWFYPPEYSDASTNTAVKIGSNNNSAYTVSDFRAINYMGGSIRKQSISIKDLSPIALRDEEVTDADRIRVAQQAYNAAIRKLKDLRPKLNYKIQTTCLPDGLEVGDQIRVTCTLTRDLLIGEGNSVAGGRNVHCLDPNCSDVFCGQSEEFLLSKFDNRSNPAEGVIDGFFYIVGINTSISGGVETNILEISTELYKIREVQDPEQAKTQLLSKLGNEQEKEDKQRKTTSNDFDQNKTDNLDETTPYRVTTDISEDLEYFLHWDLRIKVENYRGFAGVTDVSGGGAHDHNLILQVTESPPQIGDIQIFIDGIDFTPQFQAQFPGLWPPNAVPNNIYPGSGISEKFDIISAARILGVEDTVLVQGPHEIEVRNTNAPGAGLMRITILEYKQYSHQPR